ncbi:MAG: hypothetical protein AAF322_14185 [Pseudomonadota bacterium]
MSRAAAAFAAALALSSCASGFGPAVGPGVGAPEAGAPVAVALLGADGDRLFVGEPRARRLDRRADLDPNATLIAPGVALVAEPAEGAPAYVSNSLGGALARRFAGHTPLDRALAAPEVFFATPILLPPATPDDPLIVDWTIRRPGRPPLGAVYAQRRLTGPRGATLWLRLSASDAEHIALQTAAGIEATPEIRLAVARAAARAEIAETPSPRANPRARSGEPTLDGRPAPRPRPRPRR